MAQEDALLALQHKCDNVESFKELWESLDAIYMADDALSKKFLLNKQQHTIYKEEKDNQVSCIIEKLPLFWKDFKHTLKHKKEELTQLRSSFGQYLRNEEIPHMAHRNDKPKAKMLLVLQLSIWLNIVNDIVNSAFMSTSKLNDSIIWHARLGHVHFKRMQDMSNNGLILAFDTDIEKFCYVYLLHTKDDALDKFKVFKTEIELQQGALIKRFRIDMGVPRPSQRSLVNETEYIGGLVVPEDEEVTDEDDPKTFDEAMKS
ncbi:zinc finger, CCHC-type containing protein [Tanacetum coccineum]